MRKSPLQMSLVERKSTLIQSCFVDMDYLAARWAYGSGIFHNFYWSSGQCIEKYMKALLLYGDRSVKGYGHDLDRLYQASCLIEPDLADWTIEMPETTGMGRETWEGERMSSFVRYLQRYGSPDGCYGLEGTFVDAPVVHPLDALCARLRGAIRRRNFISEDLFSWSDAALDLHDRLPDAGDWMISAELLLERLFHGRYHVGQAEALRGTFRSMNFAFFRERAPGEATFGGQHLSMAPLLNHLFRLEALDASGENARIVDGLRAWAMDSMQLPREVALRLRKGG